MMKNQKQISRAAMLAFALSLLGLTACKTTSLDEESPRTPQSFAAPQEAVTPWSYDPGPATEPGTMGRALINLNSEIPNFPALSEGVLKDQKFRPAFGPMPWRMPCPMPWRRRCRPRSPQRWRTQCAMPWRLR